MSLQTKLVAITLDCPDPLALASFYQQATGLEPHPKSDAEFAGLMGECGLFIGFQRVDDYRPPSWPDQLVPQQLHLCFKTEDDLDEAEARLLIAGYALTLVFSRSSYRTAAMRSWRFGGRRVAFKWWTRCFKVV